MVKKTTKKTVKKKPKFTKEELARKEELYIPSENKFSSEIEKEKETEIETEIDSKEIPIKSYNVKDPIKSLSDFMVNSEEKQKSSMDMKMFSESFKQIIDTLINTENEKLEKMSDLEKRSIGGLTIMNTLKEYYDLPAINLYLKSFLKFRISLDRKGRDELMKVAQILQQLHQTDMISNSVGMQNMGMGNMGVNTFGMNQNNPQITGNNEIVQPKRKRRWGIF